MYHPDLFNPNEGKPRDTTQHIGNGFADPIAFDQLTKIEGPLKRHIEQLWDEIHKMKEEIKWLKKCNRNRITIP